MQEPDPKKLAQAKVVVSLLTQWQRHDTKEKTLMSVADMATLAGISSYLMKSIIQAVHQDQSKL